HEERGFARIEIIELQAVGLVVVVVRFSRQFDVESDAVTACFVSALVGRFHDALTSAGNHRPTGAGQTGHELFSQMVIRGSRPYPCTAEDADAPADLLEGFRSRLHL